MRRAKANRGNRANRLGGAKLRSPPHNQNNAATTATNVGSGSGGSAQPQMMYVWGANSQAQLGVGRERLLASSEELLPVLVTSVVFTDIDESRNCIIDVTESPG